MAYNMQQQALMRQMFQGPNGQAGMAPPEGQGGVGQYGIAPSFEMDPNAPMGVYSPQGGGQPLPYGGGGSFQPLPPGGPGQGVPMGDVPLPYGGGGAAVPLEPATGGQGVPLPADVSPLQAMSDKLMPAIQERIARSRNQGRAVEGEMMQPDTDSRRKLIEAVMRAAAMRGMR